MANVTVKGTFKDLCSYLPDGGAEVARMIDAAYASLTPAERTADNLALAIQVATSTKAEIHDTAGAKPILMVAKSGGTACWIVYYNVDADSVTVGTTEADFVVPVKGTANEVTAILAAGLSWDRFWDTGLTVAAITTVEGASDPTNSPTAYTLYHTS